MPVNKSTQEFVPISEVRDGVVIKRDGSMVKILITSSLNFALKSADEREAITAQYQNFLNSLDFTVQILIQSRKLDIRPYLNSLEDRLKDQPNELIKIQTREYIGFIKTFTDSVNIMSKSFFVVIPYDPPVFQSAGGISSKIFGLFGMGGSDKEKQQIDAKNFSEGKAQLDQRVSVVTQGLARLGVRSIPLGTEELIELFYKMFNPGELGKVKLG
ncbi:MAG: hypothetical protein WC797_03170 [Candidatus Paceibacterota bacterium]|jgi:type IV secretory pathway VirB4 component